MYYIYIYIYNIVHVNIHTSTVYMTYNYTFLQTNIFLQLQKFYPQNLYIPESGTCTVLAFDLRKYL